MRYTLETTVEPTTQALTLSEAKAHLQVTSTADDELVAYLIDDISAQAEAYTGKALTPRTLKATFWAPVQYAAGGISTPTTLQMEHHLPYGPVSSITSVETIDTDGTTTVVDSDDYRLEGDTLVYSAAQTFAVTYETGYSSVPPGVRLGLLRLMRYAYYHRDDVVVGTTVTELPHDAFSFLDPVREVTL